MTNTTLLAVIMQATQLMYFEAHPTVIIFNRLVPLWIFNLIILCRFFETLFLPELLSNQHEIWTRYSQSSQVYWHDSRSMLGTNVCTMVCVASDSPFIARRVNSPYISKVR